MMNKRKTPRELELISLRRQLTNKEKQLLFIQERKDDELSSLQRQLDEARVNLRLIQERKAEYVLGTEIPLQLVKEGQHLSCRVAELEQQIAALRASRSVTSLLERLQKDIEELERRIKELEQLQPQEEDIPSKVDISKAIYISISLSITVIIGVLLIILPFASPPKTATVALLTYHGRYVTAQNDEDDRDWLLKAETRELKEWEEFTLLCLDSGRVALRTYHGRYVTALNDEGDRDWKLRAYTEELEDWEKFTLIDVETEQELLCSEALELLEQGGVVIALKTHHSRYVTAQNDEGDRGWKLRAFTKVLSDWEKFVLVSPDTMQCRTEESKFGCPGNMRSLGHNGDEACTETITISPSIHASGIYIHMTERGTEFGYSLWEVGAYGPETGEKNLVFGGTAAAYSVEPEGPWQPYKAIDDDMTSRWSSEWEDPQWLRITLPESASVSRIELEWQSAYAAEYCVIIIP